MSDPAERLTLLTSVIKTVVPETDEAFQLYIAQTINSREKLDDIDLYNATVDTLLWYKIVNDEKSAKTLCKKIMDTVYPTGLVAQYTDEERAAIEEKRAKARDNGWRVARESERRHVVPGLPVMARFAVDGLCYPAVVDKLTPDGGFVVTFTGYGNSECVDLCDIKIPGDLLAEKLEKRRVLLAANKTEAEMTLEEIILMEDDEEEEDESLQIEAAQPLPAPIRIADFGEKEKPKELSPEEMGISKLDEIMSKKDIKNQQKEKRKMDIARQREQRRAEREVELKEKALKTYLSNSDSGRSTAVDIHVNNYFMTSPDGSKELLHNANFSLNQGRIYGLIGSNGVGKTTLFKALAHYEVPGVPSHLRVVHVEQECRGDGYSALQTVLKADIEREILIHEEKRLKKVLAETGDEVDAPAGADVPAGGLTTSESVDAEDNAAEAAKWEELNELLMKNGPQDASQRLQQVYARMEAIDAWGAEARAANILAGLQFSPERMQAPTKALSGGWRMRVSLACSLFIQPDILLLDEPTNHLDFPAVLWLEQYLNDYPKTVAVISHDRVFLNNVITDVLHLYHRQLTCYKGDYATFEKVRADQLRTQKRQFEAQQAKIAHMQEFIDKNRANASRAALVQSRLKTIKKMDKVEEIEEDAEFTMSFPSPGDDLSGQSAIEVNNISFSYTPTHAPILRDVTVNIDCHSRVGILGANGIGKTTLIHLMMGKLEPTAGTVYRNGSARIATFAQHHMDKLRGDLTPLEQLIELFPKHHPQVIRRHLGSFGVQGSMQTQVMSSLSGGQKSRVAFAVLMWDKPHVIVMDEPTNHLDLETVDALIGAVKAFKGGVVVVSHDQHFLGSVCGEYWAVSDGHVKRFHEFKDAKTFSYSNVAAM